MKVIFFVIAALLISASGIHEVPLPAKKAAEFSALQNLQGTYVPAARADPEHVRLLDRRRDDLDRLLNFYNYNRKASPWEFKELRSLFLKNNAVFIFESVPPSEGSSSFVAIVPVKEGEIRIIPLWDHGLRPLTNLEVDPHNVAIFNALVASERPLLDTNTGRLAFAILYLHFFEEYPEILDEKNLATILGHVQGTDLSSLLPSVSHEGNGGFAVHLFEKVSTDSFAEFSFSVDKDGMVRSVTKEIRAKGKLLDD